MNRLTHLPLGRTLPLAAALALGLPAAAAASAPIASDRVSGTGTSAAPALNPYPTQLSVEAQSTPQGTNAQGSFRYQAPRAPVLAGRVTCLRTTGATAAVGGVLTEGPSAGRTVSFAVRDRGTAGDFVSAISLRERLDAASCGAPEAPDRFMSGDLAVHDVACLPARRPCTRTRPVLAGRRLAAGGSGASYATGAFVFWADAGAMGGTATGSFRLQPPTGTLAGSVTCLRVADGIARVGGTLSEGAHPAGTRAAFTVRLAPGERPRLGPVRILGPVEAAPEAFLADCGAPPPPEAELLVGFVGLEGP